LEGLEEASRRCPSTSALRRLLAEGTSPGPGCPDLSKYNQHRGKLTTAGKVVLDKERAVIPLPSDVRCSRRCTRDTRG